VEIKGFDTKVTFGRQICRFEIKRLSCPKLAAELSQFKIINASIILNTKRSFLLLGSE